MRYLYKICLLFLLVLMCHNVVYADNKNPKREFRGAWIQAVNGQFLGMGEQEMKGYLVTMLNNLKRANVNAIIFQVRVEGDALYRSSLEPWSRFLTGTHRRAEILLRPAIAIADQPLLRWRHSGHRPHTLLHARYRRLQTDGGFPSHST